jgi:hypothetical protein
MTDVSFKLNASGHGSTRKAVEMKSDRIKLVCVDSKLATAAQQDAAAAGGAAGAAGAAGGSGAA